jgi:hypothetical protein
MAISSNSVAPAASEVSPRFSFAVQLRVRLLIELIELFLLVVVQRSCGSFGQAL